jgi:transmembrane sensor
MNDELLIKFLLKETTEEESITVQNWLNASPSNKSHFEQFKQIWVSIKALTGQSQINSDDAWLRFKQKVADQKEQPKSYSLKPIAQWLKIAAVLVLVAAAWSIYSVLSPVSYTQLAAGNKVTTTILPDGSELTLNKEARISYANNFKRNRSIHLQQGDVFFKVTPDKSHPFVIHADKVSVLVVGTSFNVKHLADQTEVIVETGIVKVSLGNDEITLQKGEKVLISNESGKLIKEKNTDQLYNYYRSKVFIANNTPLWRLVDVLNEAYHADIVIKDPSIKNKTLFTTLKTDTTLSYNLAIICQTAQHLKVEHNQQQIILSKASE